MFDISVDLHKSTKFNIRKHNMPWVSQLIFGANHNMRYLVCIFFAPTDHL